MPADPFAILGLPRRFDLTEDQIQSAFLALSARLHPDLATHASASGDDDGIGGALDAEGECAARLAAVNEAREVLRNPEARAGALLELLGGPGPSADRSLPPGFLPEIMGIREELEHALSSGDRDALARLRSWGEDQRRGHVAWVSRAFNDAVAGPVDAGALGAIRTRLNAWRYVERMLGQMSGGTGDRG